ncbi:hypothetical protein ABZY90_22070 [Streptomyces sp. NPDC006422]|uniref:hypothetical protein n=1 Tax=unclassified Streptomyces TaxID=2593676 RepID=UPI0033AF03FA
MRATAFTGVTAALALLATGCSPPQLPLVAIGKGPHGDVRALLHPCGGDRMQRIELLGGSQDEEDDTAVDGWSSRPPTSATGEQEISLLSPPSDWQGTARPVSRLTKSWSYSVSFVVGPDNTVRYEGIAYFTSADIDRLAPGQWWADGEPLSRAAFRSKADDAC